LRKLQIIIILLTISCISLYSQVTFTGIVKDENNNPIGFAFVKVKNQSLGAKTDANGFFKIIFPAAGTFEIEISNLNYETFAKSFQLTEGQNVSETFVLKASVKKVKGALVRGSKNKESEQATLLDQKKQVAIQEKMGAQEMSRKGASDAGAAVVKMAGISKEEGGGNQIYVRGLGDRYNTTTLNGMFLPSDNPEFKNISLDYFPIDVIQNIGVSKTYNSSLLGDFGGASIDIATKEFSGKPSLTLGIKSGLNTNAISNDNFGSGVNLLGIVENKELPTLVEGKFVERNWQPEKRSSPSLNGEININGGFSKNFGMKTKFSLFGTASNSHKFYQYNGLTKVIYASGGDAQNFNKTSYVLNVNQNAMLNMTLSTSAKFKSKLNLLGFRTVSNQVNEYVGFNNGINDSVYRRRMVKDISELFVIQSINEWRPSDKLSFVLSGSTNFIENNQPDRLTTSLTIKDGIYKFLVNNSGDHSSYYQKLADKDYSLNLNGKYKLIQDSANGNDKLTMSLGYTLRYKDRYFEQSDFVYRPNAALNNGINPNSIDAAFTESNFSNGFFTMEDENPKNGRIDQNNYAGELSIQSPSLGFDYIVSDKLSINFGTRIDFINQYVNWNITSTYPNKGDVGYSDMKILPFINLKHEISEKENLKLAFSKTYTLPQFKELAPFLYYDISTYNTRGNPYLYASDNYNLDVKYEFFPSVTELFSIAGFGKFIQNPINKIFEASAGADQMVFANSGELAMVFGTELEFKKNLIDKMNGSDSSFKYALTGGVNVSALYSRQDLNKDKISKENAGYTSAIFTKTSSGLQGASPLIFNFDLTLRMKFKKYQPQYSLVCNYFFDRLYSLGAQGAGDVYEKGVPSLDLISRHTLSDKINISFNFKNILNPDIERYQEVPGKDPVTISSFKKGMDISLGFNYNF
jgi:hypothetical protein